MWGLKQLGDLRKFYVKRGDRKPQDGGGLKHTGRHEPGVLFWPGERRISPAQDKKKSLIRRPRFFIRRPKGIYVKKFKEFLSNYLLSGDLGGRTDVCISSLLGLVSTVYCTLAGEIVNASISTP